MTDSTPATDSLANTLSSFTKSFDKYIVTPLNAFGVGGFIFDVEAETTANLIAEITDHYNENNGSLQDHIALHPKRVTLKSYVGELRYATDPDTGTIPQAIAQKLTTISSYLPELASAESQAASLITAGSGALTASNLSNNFQSLTNDAVNLWGLVKNALPPQPRQAQAYAYFKAIYEGKFLVSIQTPFEFMSSMAIESIIAAQGEESKNVSHFTITFKEMRFASTLVQAANQPVAQGPAQQQSQPVTNVGATNGIDPTSFPTLPVNTSKIVNMELPGGFPQIQNIPELINNSMFNTKVLQ